MLQLFTIAHHKIFILVLSMNISHKQWLFPKLLKK
jgi:hypothetical protein